MPHLPDKIRAAMLSSLMGQGIFANHEEIVDTIYKELASKNMLAVAEPRPEPREGLTERDEYDISTFPSYLHEEIIAGIRKYGSMEAWAQKTLEERSAKLEPYHPLERG